MVMSRFRSLTLAVTLTSALLSAGCTPHFVASDGPTAVLVVPTDGRSASIHLYRESLDCSEPVIASQGPDEASGRFDIPAGEEVSIGTWWDADINYVGAFLGWSNSINVCRLVFTFTPRANETYRVSEAFRSSNCDYEVRDSMGAVVPIIKRVATGGRLQAYCEELPAKTGH